MSTSNPPFVFFGTPHVASKTLARLIKSGYVPTLVVTAPARPQGRGLSLTETPVHLLAREHGIDVITPEKLDEEALNQIADTKAQYAIVVAYGKILPAQLLSMFPEGVLNVHYSLLPKYRGASPVETALLANEATTGVTVQKMVYELDAGAIVATKETPIEPTETATELRERLIDLGAELLIESLPTYLSGETTLREQNHEEATRCGKIAKSERELMLSGDPLSNWLRYRALSEGPGTHFYAQRQDKQFRVKIKSAAFKDGTFTPLRVVPEGKQEQDFDTLMQSGAKPL